MASSLVSHAVVSTIAFVVWLIVVLILLATHSKVDAIQTDIDPNHTFSWPDEIFVCNLVPNQPIVDLLCPSPNCFPSRKLNVGGYNCIAFRIENQVPVIGIGLNVTSQGTHPRMPLPHGVTISTHAPNVIPNIDKLLDGINVAGAGSGNIFEIEMNISPDERVSHKLRNIINIPTKKQIGTEDIVQFSVVPNKNVKREKRILMLPKLDVFALALAIAGLMDLIIRFGFFVHHLCSKKKKDSDEYELERANAERLNTVL